MIAINRPPPDPIRPVFEPGQLVRHRRYGYRGVVVDRRDFWQADEEWDSKNQTQPDRDQPWYHVLAHGTSTCTYAASESLVADANWLPIEHPLLPHFFSEFKKGIYIRNDEPWPA